MTKQRGAYPGDRAAALSGVPLSTVRYWAAHDVLVPSVSPTRTMLWSYADLIGLRIIHWLRRPKKAPDDERVIPATAMPAVRRALRGLAEPDMALWSEDGGPTVRVDRRGVFHITTEPSL